MTPKKTDWTDEELKLLEYEAFIVEVLNRRTPQSTKEVGKPKWQIFLESSGGTALITVLIGGLLGQLITWSIQNGLKEREFQQSWIKARGDQALIAYKEYLDQEQEIVKKTYELIGNCIAVSDDLISLTRTEFRPGNYIGIEEQRTSIRGKYNSLDTQWRNEREKIGLLMSYYHRGRPEVIETWNDLQFSVTDYMDCARHFYLANQKTTKAENSCKKEKDDIKAQLKKLTILLESTRYYAWEGWESPQKLKTLLESSKQ